MSSDFYFRKWRNTLANLKVLVITDIEYQETKAHDKTECAAVHRLTRVLGKYMTIYNDAMECLQQNLQVQKTEYIKDVVAAVVSRMLELKHELNKRECSNIHFFGKGLSDEHHTVYDAELKEIPKKVIRSQEVQRMIDEVMITAREKKEPIANPDSEVESVEQVEKWWETDEKVESARVIESVEELPEELRIIKDNATLIQAHEKSRQIVRAMTHRKQMRELWAKELAGSALPQAEHDLKVKGSRIIQKVLRAYFEIKRLKIIQCKRDETIGFNYCTQPKREQQHKWQQALRNRQKLHDEYEKDWEAHRKNIKEQYLRKKKDELIENYRDQTRDWFRYWFDRVQFIHEIPTAGSADIYKGNALEPEEWLEEYKKHSEQKKAQSKMSAQEREYKKTEAKKEQMMLKREEHLKMKAETALMKKIIKNPTMHPGYIYPKSKRMDNLKTALEKYDTIWEKLDGIQSQDVKEKFVHEIDLENAFMEAKFDTLVTADEEMKHEFRKLKAALKKDYESNEMQMPEVMKRRNKRRKIKNIKKPPKANMSQELINKIEDLAVKGFIVEYQKVKIEDFIGDHNYAGEDLRCNLIPAQVFSGEIRAIWWDKCREVTHGFRKILLVGPKGCGKTKLVHALASLNDAILLKLDPLEVQGEFLSAPYLQQIVQTVALCARAVQPAVIHIAHVEKLFYSKVPHDEEEMCLDLIKNFFITKLFKRFQKSDNITIIGSCHEPWTTKSKSLLKAFPKILLLPRTNYSVIIQMLNEWVISHRVIPANFNVSNLAYVLQGYSFGYLQQTLENFMTADRIVQIAAYGLKPKDVYNYIIDDRTASKIHYEKYLSWYIEKTKDGKREDQHLQEQKEFKLALAKYIEKMKKKNKVGLSNKSSKSTLRS